MRDEDLRNYWETTKPSFAHIEYTGVVAGAVPFWKEHFLGEFDWKDKIVVDYGTGGGLLGEVLFNEYKLAGYIGVDIAQRSIDSAKDRLHGKNADFYLTPVDFSMLDADIFVCQAVIQHFPTLEYVDSFLENLNASGISQAMLQIRAGDVKINQGYATLSQVAGKCWLNAGYISDRLRNYELTKAGDVLPNKYQFLFYDKII